MGYADPDDAKAFYERVRIMAAFAIRFKYERGKWPSQMDVYRGRKELGIGFQSRAETDLIFKYCHSVGWEVAAQEMGD